MAALRLQECRLEQLLMELLADNGLELTYEIMMLYMKCKKYMCSRKIKDIIYMILKLTDNISCICPRQDIKLHPVVTL